MDIQLPDMNEMTDSLKDLTMTGMLEKAMKESFGTTSLEEQPIPDPTIDQINILETSDSLPNHQILIVNQPELVDYKFRHESEKQHAMQIKGQKVNGSNWPEIKISGNPKYPAEIWIQLVEQRDDVNNNPRPSPNGLFLKKDKKSKGFSPPPGVIIESDGSSDGIIKLKIPDLTSVGGRICFDERLPLALFRTKACDVWKYLEQKNKANQDTLNKIPRLSAIELPKNPKEAKKRCKTEMDTTRVRLCFQVFLQIGELQTEDSNHPQPVTYCPDPMCSEVIVDKHAHQQLRIDASAPIIATDEGIDHCIILCSKIEDSDLNNLKLIFTFRNESGQDIIVEKPIPKRNPSSALIHKQAAIKFGKIHDFDMPIYRELVKKLDIDTHVYGHMQLCKSPGDSNDYAEISNPIEVIIFPEGHEKRKGRCIGTPLGNRPSKYCLQEESSSLSAINNAPIATENVPNTDRVLNGILEMESQETESKPAHTGISGLKEEDCKQPQIKLELNNEDKPKVTSNLLQGALISSAEFKPKVQPSKLPSFQFGIHNIVSPNKAFKSEKTEKETKQCKRQHEGPSGLTDESMKPPHEKQ